MDVLAIILACSLHPDDQLVRTLVSVQSSGNPFFVGDLKTLKTNDSLRSAEVALRFAEDLHAHGGRPAVGLLGVPLDWAPRFGRAPIDLFDACTNVSIATAMFADYYQRCAASRAGPASHRKHRRATGHSDLERARYCVVTSFARDLGVKTAAPVILRELLANDQVTESRSIEGPPERSPPFGRVPSEGAAASVPRILLQPSPAAHPR